MMPSIIAISAGSSMPNPASTSAASRTAQGWASGAGRSSAAMPGSSRTTASLCATTASASSSSHCSRPHASSWLQGGWPKNCENRLLVEDRIYYLSLLRNCAIDYEHDLICDLIQSDWALMAPGIERSNLAKRILPSLSGNLKALVSMSLPEENGQGPSDADEAKPDPTQVRKSLLRPMLTESNEPHAPVIPDKVAVLLRVIAEIRDPVPRGDLLCVLTELLPPDLLPMILPV